MSSCGDSSDFIIPKGKDFDFTVQIMEEDSFLPQNLEGFSDGSLTLIELDTGEAVTDFPVVPLTKMVENVTDAVVLVEEVTEVSIATLEVGEYSITIDGTKYSESYTVTPTTLDEVAVALLAKMGALPQNITVTQSTNVLTITNTIGEEAIISFTANIAITSYTNGTVAVDAVTSTFFNDNGYLEGSIAALDTDKLEVFRRDEVDDYHLKVKYQGVIQVNFSDSTPNKTALICEIYVIYTGS